MDTEVKTDIAEIKTAIKGMYKYLEKIAEKVESHDHLIRGNGKPGINTRLALLEKETETQKEDADKKEARRSKNLMAIWVFVSTIIGKLLFDHFKG